MVAAVVPVALVVGVLSVLTATYPRPSLAAEVSAQNSELVVTSSEAIGDILDIRPVGFLYEIYDAADTIEAGPGCLALTENLAYCTSQVVEIRVEPGPGDDIVGLWDVAAPVVVLGGEGDDFVEGGEASDRLDGGEGDDGLVGAGGDDWLAGDAGADVVSGGDGADTLQGDAGNDVLQAQAGDRNVVLGGSGRDLLAGGAGSDRLAGDEGNDALIGNGGEDEIDGGSGRDELIGGNRHARDCHARRDRRRRPRCGRSVRQVSGGPPRIWPRHSRRTRRPSAGASQLPPPDPKVRVYLRRPGSAVRATVCIKSEWFVPDVRVRVRTYTWRRRQLKAFKTIVDASTCRSLKHPSPGRSAFFARGRLPGDRW